MGKFFKEKILRFFMQKCPLFWSKLDIFPVFCEILQNPPLFEKIPQFPILKNLSPLLGQKSHKTGKFPPSGRTDQVGQLTVSSAVRRPDSQFSAVFTVFTNHNTSHCHSQCGQKGGIFLFCGIFGPKGGTDF